MVLATSLLTPLTYVVSQSVRKIKEVNLTRDGRGRSRMAMVKGNQAGPCKFFRLTPCSLRPCRDLWYGVTEVHGWGVTLRSLTRQLH